MAGPAARILRSRPISQSIRNAKRYVLQSGVEIIRLLGAGRVVDWWWLWWFATHLHPSHLEGCVATHQWVPGQRASPGARHAGTAVRCSTRAAGVGRRGAEPGRGCSSANPARCNPVPGSPAAPNAPIGGGDRVLVLWGAIPADLASAQHVEGDARLLLARENWEVMGIGARGWGCRYLRPHTGLYGATGTRSTIRRPQHGYGNGAGQRITHHPLLATCQQPQDGSAVHNQHSTAQHSAPTRHTDTLRDKDHRQGTRSTRQRHARASRLPAPLSQQPPFRRRRRRPSSTLRLPFPLPFFFSIQQSSHHRSFVQESDKAAPSLSPPTQKSYNTPSLHSNNLHTHQQQ